MIRLLVALPVTVALGILSRLYPIAYSLDDSSLGDAPTPSPPTWDLHSCCPTRRAR
jgi:hypothetical protein